MHACMHAYIHYSHYITLHYITLHYITLHYITYIHTYIHACMHTYIHTYIHTCIHTFTLPSDFADAVWCEGCAPEKQGPETAVQTRPGAVSCRGAKGATKRAGGASLSQGCIESEIEPNCPFKKPKERPALPFCYLQGTERNYNGEYATRLCNVGLRPARAVRPHNAKN